MQKKKQPVEVQGNDCKIKSFRSGGGGEGHGLNNKHSNLINTLLASGACKRQHHSAISQVYLRAPPYRVAINSPAKPGEFLKIIITKSGSI